MLMRVFATILAITFSTSICAAAENSGNADGSQSERNDAGNKVYTLEEERAQVLERVRSAAERGAAIDQFRLGLVNDLGEGVEENKDEAVHWYTRSAEQDFSLAQIYLSVMFKVGDGVEANVEKSVYWAKRAAENEAMAAQHMVGEMYAEGRGVEKDEIAAAEWFGRAARQGDYKAQHELAKMYRSGIGVSKDLLLAYAWADHAAFQKHEDARDLREQLGSILTKDEIEKAMELARDLCCFPVFSLTNFPHGIGF